MGKYIIMTLLWSPSLGRYVEPGEEIEIKSEAEKILLNLGAIRRVKADKSQPVVKEDQHDPISRSD
jgi:hypothetical protein